MALITTEAFVLRSYKLAENDKIVVMFTRELGKIRFVAKGARKLRNRFGAALELFTRLRILFYEKPNRELQTLDRAEILYSPFEKQRKLRISAFLFYFADLVHEFYPDHEKNLQAYGILVNIEKAVRNRQNLDYLARYVELQLLHSQGILSSVASCSHCNRRFETLQERRYLGPATEILCKRCRDQEAFSLPSRLINSIHLFEKGDSAWATSLQGETMQELASLNHLLMTRFLGKDLPSHRIHKQLSDHEVEFQPQDRHPYRS
jgi:DNA repair protein RecO (recombination protein O)